MRSRNITSLMSILLLVSGCGLNMNSNVYTSDSASGKVLEGKIVSMRAVTIKDHDKLEQNTAGG